MKDQMYEFTAICGIQAGRTYYLLLCPLKLIPQIFFLNEAEVPAELRAQRVLNKGRIREMKQYLLENPEEYTLSALTATVDDDVKFKAIGEGNHQRNIGVLRVSMTATIVINDGQHRRAAIQEALRENPNLRYEHIPIILFIDRGLKRSQQMFSDLNRHAVRPTKSLGILYDDRDPLSRLARRITEEVSVFKDMTEMEKTSLSNRSSKLFTLSGIYHASCALLEKKPKQEVSKEEADLAIEFWEAVASHIPDWQMAKKKEVSSHELREQYIHAHAICLHALGNMGVVLLQTHPNHWKQKLAPLKKVEWSGSEAHLWEGRAMLGGKVNKARQNITLTTIALKEHLKLRLTEKEQATEALFLSIKKTRP